MTQEDRLMANSSLLQELFAEESLVALNAMSVSGMPSWITEILEVTPAPMMSVDQLGSDVMRMLDTTGGSLFAGIDLAGAALHNSIEQLGLNSLAAIDASYASIGSLVDPTVEASTTFTPELALENSLAAVATAVTSSLKTDFMQELIDHAKTFRSGIGDLDFDQRSEELYATHRTLAETIESQPVVVNLSESDRKLIVWFIGTIVAIYVTMSVVNISLASPELSALFSGLGLSGPPIGIAAGKAASKLLDKLPAIEHAPPEDERP